MITEKGLNQRRKENRLGVRAGRKEEVRVINKDY